MWHIYTHFLLCLTIHFYLPVHSYPSQQDCFPASSLFLTCCCTLRYYWIVTPDLHDGTTDRFWETCAAAAKLLHLSRNPVRRQSTAVWSRLQQRNRALLNDVVMEWNPIILLLGDVEMHRRVDLLSKVSVKSAQFSPSSTLTWGSEGQQIYLVALFKYNESNTKRKGVLIQTASAAPTFITGFDIQWDPKVWENCFRPLILLNSWIVWLDSV